MRKKSTYFFLIPVVLVFALIAFNFDLLTYGIAQGQGQLRIIWNARQISEVLTDPATPDSIKEKLNYIAKVRDYAIDSLGLSNTDNYTTYFEQNGKEIMWVVTACEPFSLKEKIWEFPIAGKVPYKGFFSINKAKVEAAIWKDQGLDVSIRNPGGWSTLGWFTDPILSGMLNRSKGDLASLIIHEMAHATIYVKDSSTFNENLASFIGDEGAKKFLKSTYGVQSAELQEFEQEDRDYRIWVDHFLRGAAALDSLYSRSGFHHLSDSVKYEKKYDLIRKIVESTDTLKLSVPSNYHLRSRRELPNNTYFMSFIRYQAMQTDFTDLYRSKFNRQILPMIEFFRKNHPVN